MLEDQRESLRLAAAESLGKIATAHPDPRLREALRILWRYDGNLPLNHPIRRAIERIEEATRSLSELPAPSSAPSAAPVTLPIPAESPKARAESLPIPSTQSVLGVDSPRNEGARSSVNPLSMLRHALSSVFMRNEGK
jgi:hypothetical protein